jgi:hypothetical protein
MPNIIDLSYFQQANPLNIPLSVQMIVANPTLETPNSANALTELITKVEKSILSYFHLFIYIYLVWK